MTWSKDSEGRRVGRGRVWDEVAGEALMALKFSWELVLAVALLGARWRCCRCSSGSLAFLAPAGVGCCVAELVAGGISALVA